MSIYLDNGATSFPKAPGVLEKALARYLAAGASPGRGGYDAAVLADQEVGRVRKRLAGFFAAPPGSQVCFAYNATDALNTLLAGLAKPGDHLVSTRLEHNSVLRPLFHMQREGRISYSLVPFGGDGLVDPQEIKRAIRPETGLVVLNHASNVLGTVQPVAEIGAVCAEAGVPLVLDASQSAGLVEMDMAGWGVSALAFTGHKSLLGPTGIGGLVLAPGPDIRPVRFGGTGVDSASPLHTMDFPHRLEAGTINLFGALALDECLTYLAETEKAGARERELALAGRLGEGLAAIDGVRLYCWEGPAGRIPLLSCNLEGHRAGDVAAILDGDYEIAVRSGLHCAPLVHESLGTAPAGSIRFSLGPFTTAPEVDQAVAAMAAIAARLG